MTSVLSTKYYVSTKTSMGWITINLLLQLAQHWLVVFICYQHSWNLTHRSQDWNLTSGHRAKNKYLDNKNNNWLSRPVSEGERRWEGLGSQVSAADTVGRQLDSFCGISLDSDSFSQDPSCCGFYYYKPPRTAPFRKLEALLIQQHREQAGLFLLHNWCFGLVWYRRTCSRG